MNEYLHIYTSNYQLENYFFPNDGGERENTTIDNECRRFRWIDYSENPHGHS